MGVARIAARLAAASARRFLPALGAASLALVLSCADMPNSPKAMIRATGTILDKDGQPMFGVALYFWNPDIRFDPYTGEPTNVPPGELPQYDGVTQVDGMYDVTLPEGAYRIVVVPMDGSGYARAGVQARLTRENPRWDYRYAWPAVTVRVVEPGGAPIPNSRVVFFPRTGYEDPFFPSPLTEARRRGDELEAVVPPGSYRLFAQPGGYTSGYLSSYFDLAVTGDTTITLTEGGYTILAHLTGHPALPTSGAYLTVYDSQRRATAIADAAGTARFHLAAGSYSWRVYPPVTYATPRIFPSVTVSGDATIELDMGGTQWTGTVRRTGDLLPLANVIVVVEEIGGYVSATAGTGATGSFQLIVRTGAVHRLRLIEPGDPYRELRVIPEILAGADSTFDLVVDAPAP